MPSERMQRRIDALLDEADEAVTADAWSLVASKARAVLAIDEANEDAAGFLKMAQANGIAGEAPATPTSHASEEQPARAAEPDSYAGGRYVVQRFLGEGGKKRVYLAHDELLDRDVAFALIKTEGLDDVGRERVVREAQAMGRMGVHPHIVSILDFGEADGAPYVVTELMGGGDVEGLLEDADGPLPLARALDIAKATADGLVFAHAQGVVHRDLKPGNVWLTSDGAAKIGDFGLAVAEGRSRLTQHGMMVGTFGYMPPEQALGQEVTPQADLYSLGAMLYELVTGKPPFVGDDATAVISQHINTAPVRPSLRSEHCPPELETLILRLLAKAPADRPASATDVVAALDGIDPEARSASDSQLNPLDRLARGVFVGRETELERLRGAADEAFAGRGSVVMLVGEPGIGKTRTVQELGTYVRMRGAKLLWGRSHEASGAPAFWPWTQIGRDYAGQVEDALLSEQLRDYAFELQRLFPPIRQRFPDLPEPPPAESEEAQFQLFDALSGFFRDVSRETPLLLVLDDLHWADRPTLRLLTHVSREIGNARLLVLGTYRDTDLDRQHPLSLALGEMNREQLFSRVLLRGLSEPETAAYIRSTTNIEPSPSLARRIHVETEGNPFFLSEVVNLMAEEGSLGADSLSDVAIPEGVKEALGRRLDRLSPEANELLSVAAVIGREFDHVLLAELTAHDADALLELVEEALAARVIEETSTPGEYRFTHALMQEALYGELSTARRVRMHGRIAETLEQQYADELERHAAELARHFMESSVLNRSHAERAAGHSFAAGRAAVAVTAWDDATRHFSNCLATLEESGEGLTIDAAELRLSLARAERFAGEIEQGLAHGLEAVDAFRERGDWLGFARAVIDSNDFIIQPLEQRRQRLDEALTALGDRDSGLRAMLLFRKAYAYRADDRVRDEAAADARTIAERDGLTAVLGRLTIVEVYPLIRDGAFTEIEQRFEQAWRSAEEIGDFHGAAGSRRILATFMGRLGSLDASERYATAAIDYATRIHYAQEVALAQAQLASVRVLRGNLAASADLVHAFSLGSIWGAAAAHYRHVQGDTAAAWRLLEHYLELPGNEISLSHYGVAASLAAVAGDEAAARAMLVRRAELLSSVGRTFLNGGALSGPIWTLLGREELQAEYDALVERHTLRVGITSVSLDVARGEAALALDLVEEAEQHFRTGLEWCERERCPVEAGRCLQGLAEVAGRRGEREQAMEYLDRAGELFSRHGAKLYLDQVLAKKEILKA